MLFRGAPPLIPRESARSAFGQLKNEWVLAPLRVRGLERARLHVDLTILAELVCRLASERALALAA
jgi:hypothetical protein